HQSEGSRMMCGVSEAFAMIAVDVEALRQGVKPCALLEHAPGKIIVVRARRRKRLVHAADSQRRFPPPAEQMFYGRAVQEILPLEVTAACINRTDGVALAVDIPPGGVEEIDMRLCADRAVEHFNRVRSKDVVS